MAMNLKFFSEFLEVRLAWLFSQQWLQVIRCVRYPVRQVDSWSLINLLNYEKRNFWYVMWPLSLPHLTECSFRFPYVLTSQNNSLTIGNESWFGIYGLGWVYILWFCKRFNLRYYYYKDDNCKWLNNEYLHMQLLSQIHFKMYSNFHWQASLY